MNRESIVIFSDGSSRGNPGPGGFAAVVVIPKDDEKIVIEIGGREKRTTNNRMELTAASEAIALVQKYNLSMPVVLYTDSSYVINGITKWILGWKNNGWKTKEKKDVLNADLWQKLDAAKSGIDVSFKYIGGHVGVLGNERADFLATAFADEKATNLYEGPLSEYPLRDILNINSDALKIESREKSKDRSRGKAYSYLSEVKGDIKIHKTWAECEARVKGIAGAKYRKALTPEEESMIISAWRDGKRPEF